jgi:hypothetical protein
MVAFSALVLPGTLDRTGGTASHRYSSAAGQQVYECGRNVGMSTSAQECCSGVCGPSVPTGYHRVSKNGGENRRIRLCLFSQLQTSTNNSEYDRIMRRFSKVARELDLLRVTDLIGSKPTFFDPHKKRNEFFRLQRGDTAQLVAFLNTVGLFESARFAENGKLTTAIAKIATRDYHSVHYEPLHSARNIWNTRDLLVKTMAGKTEFGHACDFQTRIVREKEEPRVVITTATLVDAVLLSILIDRVKKLRVQKCARPDCGVLFSVGSGHERKYCERNCAHVESVRRDRERKKANSESSGYAKGR